jgi:uncharacterized membrane protein
MPSATVVPHWPVPLPDGGDAAPLGQARCPSSDGAALQWDLRRNCSLTPRQLAAAYGGLCLLSLLISVPFALQGAAVVLVFAGLELLAVGAALLVFARHVRDGETLTLAGTQLHVEQVHGSRLLHSEFHAGWVSVEPRDGEGSLVELSGQGQRVLVGRFLSPHRRPQLARELRLALRAALAHPIPAQSV